MKRLLYLFSFLLLSQTTVQAQKLAANYYNPKIDNYSFHFGIGFASYAGDVATFGENIFPSPERLQTNIGIAYRLQPQLRVRWQLSYYGVDANTYKARYLDIGAEERRSGPAINGLLESNMSVVYDFVSKNAIDKGLKKFNVYAVAGLGVTFIRENKILATATKPKVPLAPVLLLGGGMEYYIQRNISIAFEYGFRLSTSDLLDGVKGNTGVKDMYLMYGYKLNYAPTHGFSFDKYRKKHQRRDSSNKKFLGLF